MYQPPPNQIAMLAYELWENYGAAGFELDSKEIWYQAIGILRWQHYCLSHTRSSRADRDDGMAH